MNCNLLLFPPSRLLRSTPVSAAQTRGKINVDLIGGHSNASGKDYLANRSDTMKIDTNILVFHPAKPHVYAGKPACTWISMQQASGSTGRFGPEPGFNSKIRLFDKAKQIAHMERAQSGTMQYKQWNYSNVAGDTAHWRRQFNGFVQTATAGLNELKRTGFKTLTKGILGQQGQNHSIAIDSASARYGQNNERIFLRLCVQVNTHKMPTDYGYVLPPPQARPDRRPVPKAKHDIDRYPGSIMAAGNVVAVFTTDLHPRVNDKNTPSLKYKLHVGTDRICNMAMPVDQQFASY